MLKYRCAFCDRRAERLVSNPTHTFFVPACEEHLEAANGWASVTLTEDLPIPRPPDDWPLYEGS